MPLQRAKAATEKRLARSRMRRVAVRPDAFQEIHLAPIGRFDIQAGKVAVFGKGTLNGDGSPPRMSPHRNMPK